MNLTLAKLLLFHLVTCWLSICAAGSNSTTGSNSSTTVSTMFNSFNTMTSSVSPTSASSLMSSVNQTSLNTSSLVPSMMSPTPFSTTMPSATYVKSSNRSSKSSSNSTSMVPGMMSPTPAAMPSVISQKSSGESSSKSSSNSISTSSSTTVQSSTTPTMTKSSTGNGEALAIILAVVAGVATIVAVLSLLLYFRTSHSCYHRLRRGRSTQSPDAFEFERVSRNQSSAIPLRARLPSLSSIRRQAICKSEPFSIMDYRDHVKRLHADSDYLFSLEYEAVGNKKYLNDVDKRLELTSNEGKKLNNKPKNRFTDILPYDHSRVVLTQIEDEPDSMYINANYVDSYRKPRAYIAAQGPLSASLADFWRMIWESNARVVVMVTNLFERTKSKCAQYWPNKGSTIYGFLRVSMIKEETFAHYVIRTLSVEPFSNQTHYIKIKNESESRVIQQFQFTEWPDHDVPVHPVALLRYVRHSKSANPPDAGPLIVHCSAGVGRSGAYIVVDSMMERIQEEKNVDIFNFLNHIRTQRVYLVQEESQYVFVHDCILEYINFGYTNIPIREFHKRLESLRKVDPDTKKSRLREEYEDIDKTKHPDKHKWAGKKSCNVGKNRRKDILPVERTRVKLPPVLGIDGADYINASFIDGFGKKREYIATQAPMVKTAECFYRMICSTDCSIIVMLLDDEQWKKDDYADLPTEDEAVICGRFEINLESQEITEKVTIRKLRLFSSERSDGHTITHYHYRDWPSGGFPKDTTSLINFIEQVRDHRMAESPDHPITVYCDHGVGPTGVFCLVSSLYDQIEREKCVDVFHAAKLFRVQRPKLIETEDLYSFCYDVLDWVIARKIISMSTDSENDEPNSPDTMGNLSPSNPNGIANHSTRMNGSVVMDSNSTSHVGNDRPQANVESCSSGNIEPGAGCVTPSDSNVDQTACKSPRQINKDESTNKDSLSVGEGSPLFGTVSPIAVTDISIGDMPNKKIPNNASGSDVAGSANPNEDVNGPQILDVEQHDKSSSRQALLPSS